MLKHLWATLRCTFLASIFHFLLSWNIWPAPYLLCIYCLQGRLSARGSSQSTCGNGSAPHHVSPPTPPLQNTLHMHNCTLLDTLHCTQRTLRCKTHSTLLFVQKMQFCDKVSCPCISQLSLILKSSLASSHPLETTVLTSSWSAEDKLKCPLEQMRSEKWT